MVIVLEFIENMELTELKEASERAKKQQTRIQGTTTSLPISTKPEANIELEYRCTTISGHFSFSIRHNRNRASIAS